MELKRLEHSYLHELFKAVLLYDAEPVKKMLASRVGGRLLKTWILLKPYQEITPTPERERYIKSADIVWVLQHPDRKELGVRKITHEVKTGEYRLNEILSTYKGLHFVAFKPKSYAEHSYYPTCGTTNSPIFIWGWRMYHQKSNNSLIHNGSARQLPLDWLCPILEGNLKEIGLI